jgi:hypothetical protein
MREEPFVIEKCIGYLCKIASTGVEDKMPRTKIIISSVENILEKTYPKIMDPSYGFGDKRPNVFSSNFFQTFKNWALLSGCICLSPRGDIVAVGREISGFDRPNGHNNWGIASSSKFDCIIIEVIDKDHIMVYKNGTITMEIKNERVKNRVSPFGNA